VSSSVSREATDETLVESLARGATQVSAAADAGVSDRTVRRRLEDPEFVAQVRAVRRELVDQATDEATALLSEAIESIADVMRTGDPATRLRAATAMIGIVDRLHYQQDFDERLAAQEATHESDDREEEAS
jgi:hypothetical protein